MDYDFAVIGSGFGGSVSALRLAEKGYRVVVIEQGNRVTPVDMEEASKSMFKLFWMPSLGMKGFFTQSFFKHVNIVGGVGVGGGSIVYAAVLLRPKDDFYRDPSWSGLGVDWKKELKKHYDTAGKMLGLKKNPGMDIMDEYLKKTAKRMGALATFGTVYNGIYFGTPEITREDPFFGGLGPARDGCHLCGECLTGCKHGSKNTLDKNYLYLAEKLGATILPNRKVTNILPAGERRVPPEALRPDAAAHALPGHPRRQGHHRGRRAGHAGAAVPLPGHHEVPSPNLRAAGPHRADQQRGDRRGPLAGQGSRPFARHHHLDRLLPG